MANRVVFSGDHPLLKSCAVRHRDLEASLRAYYGGPPQVRFAGYTKADLTVEMEDRLAEIDRMSALSVLSAVEAAFRIDFLLRCYDKQKDKVSRAFRDLYKEYESRVQLEDQIFEVWKKHYPEHNIVLGHLKGAFKYRHWLAHGRYWTAKFGRKFDFDTVYDIADTAFADIPLIS